MRCSLPTRVWHGQQETGIAINTVKKQKMNMISRCILAAVLVIGFGSLSRVEAEPISNDYSAVIEQAKLATVGILQSQIETTDSPEYGLPVAIRGSGIHIGKGVILTARHAVERSEGGKIVVPDQIHVLTDDLQEVAAIRQGANTYLDVALYTLQGSESVWPRTHVSFAEDDATYGDDVFTVGYPMGRGPALSFGKVGNPNTFLSTVQSRLVQIDLSACRGNSGGGLLNEHGQLVGLVHAIIQTEDVKAERGCSRFGFAVPGRLVQRVVEAVLAGKIPGFSVLGIHLETTKKGERWVLSVAKATGPSRHAGFRKGDVLLTIDDLLITTPAQLKNYLIEDTRPGQTVSIHVKRGDSHRTISVTLGESR